MQPSDRPNITIFPELTRARLHALRDQSRKDIWLFGGGEIFRSLLELRQVDTVEVSIMPVLLGGGAMLLPPPPQIAKLKLSGHRTYGSGIVSLIYDVQR